MKLIASLVLALLGLVAVSPAADASSYALFGIGPKAGVGGELDDVVEGDTRSLRFGLGQRIGPVALEGSLFGADFVGTGRGFAVGQEFATLSLGIDLKGFFTVIGPIELFGKAGLNQTWMLDTDYDGTGWELGGGAQFVLDLAVGYAAVWVDFTHQDIGLRHDVRRDIDGNLQMVLVGASLGL